MKTIRLVIIGVIISWSVCDAHDYSRVYFGTNYSLTQQFETRLSCCLVSSKWFQMELCSGNIVQDNLISGINNRDIYTLSTRCSPIKARYF